MIDLTPLEPLCDPLTAAQSMARLRAAGRPVPDRMIVGTLGRLGFVVTIDGQGDCEASISVEKGRPTPAQAAAFFRHWGRALPENNPVPILGGRGLLWVIAKGVRH